MREDLIELAKQQAAEIARAGHNGWGNTMLALAATLESSAPVEVEDKARAMFEAQADKLTAPWDRQWEPTKGFWRKRAAEALAQQPPADFPHDLLLRIRRATVKLGWSPVDTATGSEAVVRQLVRAIEAAPAQQPAACTACNGRGEVGGATPEGFETHPCPECEQQPAAVDEATRRDAERYRWLRDNAGAWEVSRDPGEWTKCDTGEKYKPRVYFTAFGTGYGGMFLDDAIDAAMQGANT